MSIRLRTVNGIRVALCAAETDPEPGDVYLDDGDHYALAAKFCRDWQGVHEFIDWQYPEQWAAMDTQKLRDAQEELDKWLAEQERKMVFDLLEWEDGRCLYVKGHHDKELFCERAVNVYGGLEVSPPDVHQGYARWCGYFEDGKYKGQYLDYPVRQGRGAFKITYAETFVYDEDEAE